MLLLKCDNLVGDNSDGNGVVREHAVNHCAAKGRLQHSSGNGHRLRRGCPGTYCGSLAEGAHRCAVREVEGRQRPEHIFIEDPDAPADGGFSTAGWIPGKSELWPKIQIWLSDRIVQTCNQSVELRNGGIITIGSARLTYIAQTITQSDVLLPFPTVAHM